MLIACLLTQTPSVHLSRWPPTYSLHIYIAFAPIVYTMYRYTTPRRTCYVNAASAGAWSRDRWRHDEAAVQEDAAKRDCLRRTAGAAELSSRQPCRQNRAYN